MTAGLAPLGGGRGIQYSAERREHTFDVSYGAFTSSLESLLFALDVEFVQSIVGESPASGPANLGALAELSDLGFFQKIDHGKLRAILTGQIAPAATYVVGNPWLVSSLARHEPRTGLYVPLRIYVGETGPLQTLVTYDLPSLSVAQFGSQEIDAAAMFLDAKIYALVLDAAEIAEPRFRTRS